MKNAPRFFFVAGIMALLVLPAAAGTTTIDTGGPMTLLLNEDNYNPYEACDGETPGGTALHPLNHFLPEQDFALAQVRLEVQYGAGTTTGGDSLNYNYGFSAGGLTGTMLVDYYAAVDDDINYDCYHGAEIVVYYDKGAGEENLDLRFIQFYSETGDAISHPTRHTNIVDSLAPDDDPAYFGEGDEFYIPEGYDEASEDHDLTWSDAPHDSHDESMAWSGSVSFKMFLAAYGDIYQDTEGNYHQDITLYEGITWGYTGECKVEPVPLPKPLGLAATGFLILIGVRQVRRRNNPRSE